MSKARALVKRIQSIKNTKKTTYAMKLVAGAKLKKMQELTISSRAYEQALMLVLTKIFVENYENPLFDENPGAPTSLIVVVGSSRGLCGGYNVNLKKKIDDLNKAFEVEYLVLGRKLNEILRYSRKYKIIDFIDPVPDIPDINFAQFVAEKVKSRYLSGRYNSVKVVYTNFFSVLAPRPDVKTLLPLSLDINARKEEEILNNMVLEPNILEILNYLVPRIIDIKILQSLLESKCSEHASRMVAMENATKNAGELATRLTLLANKIRQASITNEILDIVGGAEASSGD